MDLELGVGVFLVASWLAVVICALLFALGAFAALAKPVDYCPKCDWIGKSADEPRERCPRCGSITCRR